MQQRRKREKKLKRSNPASFVSHFFEKIAIFVFSSWIFLSSRSFGVVVLMVDGAAAF